MHSKVLTVLSLAVGLVSAQSIDTDDYPPECNISCGPIATAYDRCDREFDDDQAELNCICTTPNMNSHLSDCLSCIEPYRSSDDDYDDAYNDVNEILLACGFSASTTATGPAIAPGPTVSPSPTVYTTTFTTTDDDGEVETETDDITAIVTSGDASPTTPVITSTSGGQTTVITPTGSPAPNSDSAPSPGSSTSPNAAAVTAAPLMGAAAGIMAAIVVL